MDIKKVIKISICIPAYERTDFLKRLLDSISIQTFKDYEVIISDDSISEKNRILVENYKNLEIKYIKNRLPLGSPKNWNYAISHSKFEWIKIMHDDDYFSNKNSLAIFADSICNNQDCNFFFSSHYLFDENTKEKNKIKISIIELIWLNYSKLILFHKNLIGHPSCTLYKKDNNIDFDNKFKWVVDIEFYYRYLLTYKKFKFIRNYLIVVSNNDSQITKQVFRNRDFEIPENLELINKIGRNKLSNLIVFDYFWRLFRNLGVNKCSDISKYQIPYSDRINKMIEFQSRLPISYLKFGVFSKLTMLIAYFYTSIPKLDAKS